MNNAPSLRELVDLYLLRCEVEGKSPRTVIAYRGTLTRFLGTVDIQRAEDVTQEHVYAYLGGCRSLAAESRHRYFREVRCFFNWLVSSDYLEKSPFRGIKNVRLPQRIVQPFAPEEIMRVLEACGTDPIGLRDRAIVMLLLDTGARCSEVVQLDLSEVDLVSGRVRILHGKGNKQRVVSFAGTCLAAIESYLEVRGREPGPLFVTSDGHGSLQAGARLKIHGLQGTMRRLSERSGVSKVHAHRFRHTFATWAIQHDARELDVQYLLGHSSPDMVRRYSSSYRSEQAALRHFAFSPADQMLGTR